MSWISYLPHHPFPIQNLPYGIFSTAKDPSQRPCTVIGETIIDLRALSRRRFLPEEIGDSLEQTTLNAFMALGRPAWVRVRQALSALFASGSPQEAALKGDAECLVPRSDAHMHLPARIGDYTDFYASKEHATNLGKMFRPGGEPLLPNWLHMPVGYHGRASSVVVSGTPITRPWGQTRPDDAAPPLFGTSKLLDMEIEMAAWIGPGNELGKPVPIAQAEDHIFGFSVFNDWSARDIQKWEYVPLGPFLGKNFASTISPWIVTLEALAPFACSPPAQDPTPLPYLLSSRPKTYDITLTATLTLAGGSESRVISETNYKYMYWTVFQQLAHHTVNGCNMQPGDVFASGTISGPTEGSYGSLIELTQRGTKPVKFPSGAERKFVGDGDTIGLTAHCSGDGYTIGFGDCEGTLVGAVAPFA